MAAPLEVQKIYVLIFYHFVESGPFRKNWSNPMTSPFLDEGLYVLDVFSRLSLFKVHEFSKRKDR